MTLFAITNHAILQYSSRFEVGDLRYLQALIDSDEKLHKQKLHTFKNSIIADINASKEDKSFKNNVQRTDYLYETYGFDVRIHFYRNDYKTFVGIEQPNNTILIVTCYVCEQSNRHHSSSFVKPKQRQTAFEVGTSEPRKNHTHKKRYVSKKRTNKNYRKGR